MSRLRCFSPHVRRWLFGCIPENTVPVLLFSFANRNRASANVTINKEPQTHCAAARSMQGWCCYLFSAIICIAAVNSVYVWNMPAEGDAHPEKDAPAISHNAPSDDRRPGPHARHSFKSEMSRLVTSSSVVNDQLGQ